MNIFVIIAAFMMLKPAPNQSAIPDWDQATSIELFQWIRFDETIITLKEADIRKQPCKKLDLKETLDILRTTQILKGPAPFYWTGATFPMIITFKDGSKRIFYLNKWYRNYFDPITKTGLIISEEKGDAWRELIEANRPSSNP
ncbi:hypothetical protein [Chitinophaga vietnamensis]|uniref:hypothetical protein n=1 Tax=Chitinophaga vietnamensis TaxID=2593957 RepID=UPI001375CE47|nr:hypothetical protein [Chitinophaga vietnamensis]